MIKRLFASFRKPAPPTKPLDAERPPAPAGSIYELLFADRLELFRPVDVTGATAWQRALFEAQDPVAVRAVAEDPTQESRVRLLAYRWLTQHGHPAGSKDVLGVVVEVGLEQGNDTLAAYADGSARYLNQAGGLAVFEGAPPEVAGLAKALVAAAEPTVEKIGPWDNARRQPPQRGDIRLSFLVADGLYFGEGPYALLRNEPLAANVIQAAERLLQQCVETALAKA